MIQSRTLQKLSEAKQNLDIFTNNIQTRTQLIAKTEAELKEFEQQCQRHQSKVDDATRIRSRLHTNFEDAELEYERVKSIYVRADKLVVELESNQLVRELKRKKEKALYDCEAYKKEKRYQESMLAKCKNDIRIYEREATYENAANKNSQPQDTHRKRA